MAWVKSPQRSMRFTATCAAAASGAGAWGSPAIW